MSDENETLRALEISDSEELCDIAVLHLHQHSFSTVSLCGRRTFFPIEIEQINIVAVQAIEYWKSRGEITSIE